MHPNASTSNEQNLKMANNWNVPTTKTSICTTMQAPQMCQHLKHASNANVPTTKPCKRIGFNPPWSSKSRVNALVHSSRSNSDARKSWTSICTCSRSFIFVMQAPQMCQHLKKTCTSMQAPQMCQQVKPACAWGSTHLGHHSQERRWSTPQDPMCTCQQHKCASINMQAAHMCQQLHRASA